MSLFRKSRIVAGLLSAALAFSAVPPASAQLGGDYNFGDGRSDSFGFFGPHFGSGQYDPDGSHFNEGFYDIRPPDCMSERQIRNAFRDDGYRDIRLNIPRGRHIEVTASKNGWVYLIEYNFCSGRIIDRERLRRS
jgi:hypothetical protein